MITYGWDLLRTQPLERLRTASPLRGSIYHACPARITKRFARMFATRQQVEKRASASVDPRELAREAVTAPARRGARAHDLGADRGIPRCAQWALRRVLRRRYGTLLSREGPASLAPAAPQRRARLYRFGAGIS